MHDYSTVQCSRCLELNCSHKWALESAALRGNSLLPTLNDHGGDDHDGDHGDHDDDKNDDGVEEQGEDHEGVAYAAEVYDDPLILKYMRSIT